MMKITNGKGFGITFANGYTVSVQFGPGNYCQHYNNDITSDNSIECGRIGSTDAECAVIAPDGELISMHGWGGDVNGWMSADDVGKLIAAVQMFI
jgi:hypothetical protein